MVLPVPGLLSWVTGSFMNRVIADPTLAVKDWGMTAAEASARFERAWEEEKAYALRLPSKAPPSLPRALWRAFSGSFLFAAFLKLLWGALMLTGVAYFVRSLLAYIRFRSTDPVHTPQEEGEGIGLACGFLLCMALLSMALQQMSLVSARLGLRVQSAVSLAIYDKCLTYDRTERSVDTTSLIANDAAKLGEACTMIHYLWSGAVEALAIMGILLAFVGRGALPGLGAVLLLVPVQYYVATATAHARADAIAASDSRVRITQEVLSSIKLVKMYVWERLFAARVAEERRREAAVLFSGGNLKSINFAIVFVTPPLIALSIFGVYILESKLEATLAFTTLSLFNTLRLPLVQLPKGLKATIEAITSSGRIVEFLMLPDSAGLTTGVPSPASSLPSRPSSPPAAVTAATSAATNTTTTTLDSSAVVVALESSLPLLPPSTLTPPPPPPGTIDIIHADFAYGTKAAPLLRGVTLHLRPGSLTIVTGGVGSGKSNLLLAVLGQMTCVGGRVSVGGSFAYVPQTSWCARGTVRDNIVFGKPWSEERYRQVLFSCALERDVELLPDADLTLIGERGSNLSGGQRQRIAIARAVYAGATTVLLDSPLSAVDAFTSQHIFRHAIKGMLQAEGATVVLVTHQEELFAKADTLVALEGGDVTFAGQPTPAALLKHFPKHPGGAESGAAEESVLTALAATASPLPPSRHRSRLGSKASPTLGSLKVPEADGSSTTLPTASSRSAGADADAGGDAPPPSLLQLASPEELATRALSLRARVFRSMTMEGGALMGESEELSPTAAPAPAASSTTTTTTTRASSTRPSAPGTPLVKGAREPSGEAPSSSASHTATLVRTFAAASIGLKLDLAPAAPASSTGGSQPTKGSSSSSSSAAPPPAHKIPTDSYLGLARALFWTRLLPIFCLFVLTQLARIYSDIWISVWVSQSSPGRGEMYYLGVYGGYVAVFLVLLYLRGVSFMAMFSSAFSRLHDTMFSALLAAPLSFHSLTPLGSIISVVSKDMDNINDTLVDNMYLGLVYLMILGTTIGVIVTQVRVFLAVVAALLLAFVAVCWRYWAASSVLKARAGEDSSALYALSTETQQGISVIQAFQVQGRYRGYCRERLQEVQTSAFTFECLQLWLTVRQDLLGALMVFATCIMCVSLERSLSPAAAGLAISNSFQILLFLSLMVRTAAGAHAIMSGVDRVRGLGGVVGEVELPSAQAPPPRWPAFGEIEFTRVSMSYLPAAPHVLKGVSFCVRPGEKIGVVGRTGAGKSSLIQALFRLAAEVEGTIRIDGADIKQLALGGLRRKIAILPQEPVMFEGTLRSNLDPFGLASDGDLQSALRMCLLAPLLDGSPLGLEQPVVSLGRNYSLGQQQLVCLARALLNDSKILLLDEATAALDAGTDAKVQHVLRTAFASRTILTIAHRIDTIIDSDRVLVMDAGRVAEFDSPAALLRQDASIFAQLCRQVGVGSFESLQAEAERHEEFLKAMVGEVKAAGDRGAF